MTKHPINWHEEHENSRDFSTRLADTVTRLVGSWAFVVVHIVWFAMWIGFKVEPFPYGLLTMIVSLEAILISTFIMISQNRQADRERAQAKAEYDEAIASKHELEERQRRLIHAEDDKLNHIIAMLEEHTRHPQHGPSA